MKKKELSFAVKTLVTSLFSGLVFVALMAVSLRTLEETNENYTDIFDGPSAVLNQAANASRFVAESRSAEKQFLHTKNEEAVEIHAAGFAEVMESANWIATIAKSREDVELGALAASVETEADLYDKAFKKVVENWRLMGLDHESGLQGDFRKTVHDVEALLKGYDVDEVYLDILYLWRWEKDWIRTQDEKYDKRLGATLAKLESATQAPNLDEAFRKGQKEALNSYKTAWGEMTRSESGSEARDAAYQKLRAAAHEIESMVVARHIPGATVQLLQLRRAEKDYLMRRLDKYITKADGIISNLKELTGDSGIPDDQKKAIAGKLDAYFTGFHALADAYAENVRLREEMELAVQNMLVPVGEIVSRAEQKLGEGRQETAIRAEKTKADLTKMGIGALVVFLALTSLIVGGNMKVTKTLKRVLIDLCDCSTTVSSASSQISRSSQNLAESCSAQSSSIEETSASLEEISSMTRSNADNAQRAQSAARETRQAAEYGASDMEKMSEAMNVLKDSSDSVAKIIKTIDEIAFQTNILALNAAVEAARAGEAGMGFAVVADEVRNLAQRSAKAATETSEIINESVSKTEAGLEVNQRVATRLHEIVSKAREVDEFVSGIAVASKEQSTGVEQVKTSVEHFEEANQTNAAESEENAAASTELNSQSQSLEQMVSTLRNVVGLGQRAVPGSLSIRTELPGSETGHSTLSPTAAAGDPKKATDDKFETFIELHGRN